MLFNSQQFLIFFAIVYTLYLLARDRVQQNIIILVASYVFYPSQTIPDGHYNSRLAAFLGAKIGSEICDPARAANAYTISRSCQAPAPGCGR